MLILTQMQNKLVNMDLVESIEIGYETGTTYTVKAVMERCFNDPENDALTDELRCVIKLGEYETSTDAEEVLRNIYYAYGSKCRTYVMPKEMTV